MIRRSRKERNVLNGMRVRPQAKHDTRTTEVVRRRCALPLSGGDTLCTLKGGDFSFEWVQTAEDI